MTLVIGFSGSRHGMTPVQKDRVWAWLEEHQPDEAHHGVCLGADVDFDDMCRSLRIRRVGHPSTIKSWTADIRDLDVILRAKPPLARNRDIVAASRVLLATPAYDSSGTRHTIGQAERSPALGLLVVEADGTVSAQRQWRDQASDTSGRSGL